MMADDKDSLFEKFGTVQLNGRLICGDKGIDDDLKIKWIHLLPQTYCGENLKKSTIYCFEDNFVGIRGMYHWLYTQGLVHQFGFGEALRCHVMEYFMHRNDEQKQAINEEIRDFIKGKNAQFNNQLKELDIDVIDSNIVEKVHEVDRLVKGPILNCSVIFDQPGFMGSAYCIPNCVFYADLNMIGWPNRIKSAIVSDGCLRLFRQINYGGEMLVLWGPNGRYSDLWGMSGGRWAAQSLQQTP
jgi:hypothetical protein